MAAQSGGGRGKGSVAPAPSGLLRKGGQSTEGPLGSKRGPRPSSLLGSEETIGGGSPEGPPVPGDTTSAAGIAALRARRRGVGQSVLTGLTEGAGTPKAIIKKPGLKPAGTVLGY